MNQTSVGERPVHTVGPFVDPSSLLLGFGCPDALLRLMTTARVVLAVPTRDGSLAYPAFQFDPSGEPLPGLPRVLEALDPDRSHAWRDAAWLMTPRRDLAGLTPAVALRAGDVDAVLAAVATGDTGASRGGDGAEAADSKAL